jgi:hypothetical protein
MDRQRSFLRSLMEKDFENEKIRTVGRSVLKQEFGTDVHIYFGSAVNPKVFSQRLIK